MSITLTGNQNIVCFRPNVQVSKLGEPKVSGVQFVTDFIETSRSRTMVNSAINAYVAAANHSLDALEVMHNSAMSQGNLNYMEQRRRFGTEEEIAAAVKNNVQHLLVPTPYKFLTLGRSKK